MPDMPLAQVTPGRSVSPAPKPYPPFTKFLDFAGVTSDFPKAREVLSAQGINDFGRLLDRNIYTIANLNSIGVPFAQAADVYKAVPLYNQELKGRSDLHGSSS